MKWSFSFKIIKFVLLFSSFQYFSDQCKNIILIKIKFLKKFKFHYFHNVHLSETIEKNIILLLEKMFMILNINTNFKFFTKESEKMNPIKLKLKDWRFPFINLRFKKLNTKIKFDQNLTDKYLYYFILLNLAIYKTIIKQ
jgi:hypothetical protein